MTRVRYQVPKFRSGRQVNRTGSITGYTIPHWANNTDTHTEKANWKQPLWSLVQWDGDNTSTPCPMSHLKVVDDLLQK